MSGLDVLPYPGLVLVLSLTNSALPHLEPLLRLPPHHQLQGGLVLRVQLHLVDALVQEDGLISVFLLSLDVFCSHMSPSSRLVVAAELTD